MGYESLDDEADRLLAILVGVLDDIKPAPAVAVSVLTRIIAMTIGYIGEPERHAVMVTTTIEMLRTEMGLIYEAAPERSPMGEGEDR